jgi:hypothetical protein
VGIRLGVILHVYPYWAIQMAAAAYRVILPSRIVTIGRRLLDSLSGKIGTLRRRTASIEAYGPWREARGNPPSLPPWSTLVT